MQIILLSSSLRQSRTIAVAPWHIAFAALVLLSEIAGGSWIVHQLAARFAAPAYASNGTMPNAQASTTQRESMLRHQVATMAARLGDLQAQLARLDVLGERVSKLVGIKPQELSFDRLPGRGGAPSTSERDITLDELQRGLDRAARDVEHRDALMARFESAVLDRSVDAQLVPSNAPVRNGFVGSGFGWRIDPFNGHRAKHDGLDFAAPAGTPIQAAAGGVVIAAQTHPDFGQMIDVDHGNGLVTRYAHASRLYVRAGDIVKRGERIADVGSTGRSTGAHLHFEVHVNGVPKDPRVYLASRGGSNALALKNTP